MRQVADPVNTPKQLGLVIQAARKAANLTQAELAQRVGMSQSRISYLELHPAQYNAGQLLQICSALGLELAIGRRGVADAPTAGEAW